MLCYFTHIMDSVLIVLPQAGFFFQPVYFFPAELAIFPRSQSLEDEVTEPYPL